MIDCWKFSKDSKESLKLFIEAVKQNPTPPNKWNTLFNPNSSSFNDIPHDTIVISDEDEEGNQQKYGERLKQENEDQTLMKEDNNFRETDLVFFETQIHEMLRSENEIEGDLCNEFIDSCIKHVSLLTHFLTRLSEEEFYKLNTAFVKVNEKNDIFYKNYFLCCLPEYISLKQPSRLLDNLIYDCFKGLRVYFLNYFLVNWLNNDKIDVDFFNNFCQLIDKNEKLILLQEILNNYKKYRLNKYFVSISNLYQSADQKTEIFDDLIVQMLTHYAEVGNGDKDYSKLLLYFVKNANLSRIDLFQCLETLCLSNSTSFRKPCLNALNKFKK